VLLSAAALLAGEPGRLLATLGGAIVLFAFYLALGMLRPGAMGGGDVKLAGVTGAFLGFLGWETVFAGALAGFVLGGIFGLALLVLRRARRDTRIAFGPFLLAGAWWAVIVAALALR
jgi:leader peptidase (prepilin peptidase) / N-methyltransferase